MRVIFAVTAESVEAAKAARRRALLDAGCCLDCGHPRIQRTPENPAGICGNPQCPAKQAQVFETLPRDGEGRR